jgi:hypothetical protein
VRCRLFPDSHCRVIEPNRASWHPGSNAIRRNCSYHYGIRSDDGAIPYSGTSEDSYSIPDPDIPADRDGPALCESSRVWRLLRAHLFSALVNAMIVVGHQHPASNQHSVSDNNLIRSGDVDEIANSYTVTDLYSRIIWDSTMLGNGFQPKKVAGTEVEADR